LAVEIRRRFIEEPERGERERQSRERDASALSGRERAHQTLPERPGPDPGKCRGERALGQATPGAHPVVQIFARREVSLERWFVAEIQKFPVEGTQVAPHVLAVPADPSLLRI